MVLKSTGSYQQQSQSNSKPQKTTEQQNSRGTSLSESTPAFCPQCGHPTRKDADICENCGFWLLESLCKFCYTPLEKGAAFCHECGNPVAGIPCPQCGRLSIFDFCPHCNIPLSQQAHQTLDQLKQSLEKLISVHQTENATEDRTLPEEQNKPQSTASSFNWDNFLQKNLLAAHHKQQESEKKSTTAAAHNNSEQLAISKALEEIQHQTFPNQQCARRHYNALKLLLPTLRLIKVKKQITVGWRCYAFDVIHPEGPHACAEPHKGGEWVFDTIEETKAETRFEEQDL